MYHWRPTFAYPMGRDQNDNAARVVVHGAGLRLNPSAKPTPIAAAIQRLLDKPGFKDGVLRLCGAIEHDTAADLAIHELETVGLVNIEWEDVVPAH